MHRTLWLQHTGIQITGEVFHTLVFQVTGLCTQFKAQQPLGRGHPVRPCGRQAALCLTVRSQRPDIVVGHTVTETDGAPGFEAGRLGNLRHHKKGNKGGGSEIKIRGYRVPDTQLST